MERSKKLLCIFMVLLIFISVVPVTNIEAAGKAKINKGIISIYVGSSETLVVTGTNEKVSWKSSNKKVATVDKNGVVTAKAKGVSLITATVSGKTLKCKVAVKNPPKPKKIVINKRSGLKATKGKAYTLSVTGTKAVSWSSSNKKVATVSSKGVVSAKKCGATTIKVKCSNKKTYKCKVLVRPQNMTYGASALYVAVNDKTFNYKTDFRNLIYDKEYYKVSFVRFVSGSNKGGKKVATYSTKFDITKTGTYLAEYKFTPVTGEESVYESRIIEVLDDADFVDSLDQK